MTLSVKKIVLSSTALLSVFSAFAQESPIPRGLVLNKITYQTSVEQWSTTTTANVTVNIDAGLDKIGLADINNKVLQNLNKIVPSNDWHITQFSRTEDKSGLETLHIEAQARLPGAALAAIRDKAKAITKPGETYTIADIDFSPSLAELTRSHAGARAAIYNDVKQEIARLNQAYPDQHYFLNAIDFNGVTTVPQPAMTTMAQPRAMFASVSSPAAPESSTPVNTKIVESAIVVIASVVQDQKLPVAAPASTPAPTHEPAPAPAPTTPPALEKVSMSILPFSQRAAVAPKKDVKG
ncbi:MAG TPA: hypothetical protein VHE99_10435 [Gammaproteobacteria bacterium]|nr:hypothetical protein [Gammaproteobacteria bacterium]